MAHFASDNWAGAHPAIIEAMVAAADGFSPAYGGDDLTRRAEKKFSEIFETDVAVFFTATGTAANGLALSAYTPPGGIIICHDNAHIKQWEYNGQSLFTGGANLICVSGKEEKITPDAFTQCLDQLDNGTSAHSLSITQQTELGTAYSIDEIRNLCDIAHQRHMHVHMDGARFANALAHLNCSPAEMTWRAGVDVMSFGGTKNGCAFADAVVVFNPHQELQDKLRIRQTQTGHGFSKARFMAAQFLAYFENDLWLQLARHANAMAQILSENLNQLGYPPQYPVQGNELFINLPQHLAEALKTRGHSFHPWYDGSYRLITSFLTTQEDVAQFCRDLQQVKPE